MALCDRLEVQQQEREQQHTALSRASLARFADAPTPANLQLLFHSSFNIHPSDLRKSILTLAVQGKLVPQDPDDEPAEEAIRRVPPQPRPARYDKRSTANIQGIAALSVGPTECEIPAGWSCVPLIQIARLESGHTPSRSRPDWWGGDVSWVGVVDARLHNGKTIFETLQHTNEEGLANSAARMLPTGTVCVSRTASVGYVTILGKPMATSQDFVNWVPSEAVTSDWLQLAFTSEKDAFNRFSKGAVHQTIYYPEWLSMHAMLPPLAEQRRIVAKVEQLMALVDALETQLSASRATAKNLLDALVAELTSGSQKAS
jgi:type I restriction enzyme S subunit